MMRVLLRHRAVVLLLLAALTFLPFLGRRDIVTSHEARVALVARQMAAVGWPWSESRVAVPAVHLVQTPQGERLLADATALPVRVNPWLVPVMNGQTRLQKPPLPYWCAAICDRLFGDNETSVRLVPALLGVIAVWLVWDWVRLLDGPVTAVYAGLVWISSYFIVDEFRKAMADPYLAFFTLMALWAWTRAMAEKKKRSWLLLFYLALGWGVVAKGPIIFVFVPILLATYHVTGRRGLPGRWIDHLLGLSLFLALSLPWPLLIWLHVPNALEFWRYESIGSFADNVEKARAWWFYLPGLFQISLPWTPLWMLGLTLPWMHPIRRRRFFSATGFLVIVLVFSLSHVKKNAYLLPLMPVQTLLIAQALRRLTIWSRRRFERVDLRTSQWSVLAAAITFCVAIVVFLNFVVAPRVNRGSAREMDQVVSQQLEANPSLALLTAKLPEEAAYYLPLPLVQRKGDLDYLAIVDDRAGDPKANLENQLDGLAVLNYVPVSPNAAKQRWHVYRIALSTPPRPTSGPADDSE